MPRCNVCGRDNAADARFCFGCGNTISQIPPVKVEVRAPLASPPPAPMPVAPIHTPRQLAHPGSCYYHPDLPSTHVCSRCGRSICVGCNKPYGMLTFCPECYWGLAPRIGSSSGNPPGQYAMGYPTGQYVMGYPPQEQSRPFF